MHFYRFFLFDNNSFNGSLVNGRPVDPQAEPCLLRDQDRVQFGSIQLVFFDQVSVTPNDWRQKAVEHPSFASHLGPAPNVSSASSSSSSSSQSRRLEVMPSSSSTVARHLHRRSLARKSALSMGQSAGLSANLKVNDVAASSATVNAVISNQNNDVTATTFDDQVRDPSLQSNTTSTANFRNTTSSTNNSNLGLVTILPSEKKYEETITVRAEVAGTLSAQEDFRPVAEVHDAEVLKEDYEKLRLAYELSKMGVTEMDELLERMLELMFSVLAVDRGVVLLKDRKR